jgi:putative oxidoreductase
MLSSLSKHKDTALLLTRLVVGSFFIFVHGLPKLMGGPERWERVGGALSSLGIDLWPQFFGLAAGLTEFVGGILIVLGLWFRPATLMIAVVLLVATIQKIAGDGWFASAHPAEVMMLMIVFAFVGAGKYSVDRS